MADFKIRAQSRWIIVVPFIDVISEEKNRCFAASKAERAADLRLSV